MKRLINIKILIVLFFFILLLCSCSFLGRSDKISLKANLRIENKINDIVFLYVNGYFFIRLQPLSITNIFLPSGTHLLTAKVKDKEFKLQITISPGQPIKYWEIYYHPRLIITFKYPVYNYYIFVDLKLKQKILHASRAVIPLTLDVHDIHIRDSNFNLLYYKRIVSLEPGITYSWYIVNE